MADIVVSGMRPTGALHLGHYVGVLSNWSELQKKYSCFFFLADWHALTSHLENMDVIRRSRLDYVKGWLAAGIDPEKCFIYTQSEIPEVLKLFTLFLSMTPPGWADRSPSWKDHKLNFQKKLDNLGFYTYPVLQAADIAIVNGGLVPVGEDQVTHLEISREIIRKTNRLLGTEIVEPKPLLTSVAKLLGPHGKKMSSSLGNVITLDEPEKSLNKKVKKLVTDPERKGIDDPGEPKRCSVYDYHRFFSGSDEIQEVEEGCRGAKLGCGECKMKLFNSMKKKLGPIADKLSTINNNECEDILNTGNKKVKQAAKEHWEKVKDTIGF